MTSLFKCFGVARITIIICVSFLAGALSDYYTDPQHTHPKPTACVTADYNTTVTVDPSDGADSDDSTPPQPAAATKPSFGPETFRPGIGRELHTI